MPQSSEDSSTTVHSYQSISQPAPLPDTSWLPNTAQASNLATSAPHAWHWGQQLWSQRILPFFFLQCPPRLYAPEHTLRPSLTLLLPTLLPSCPWDNRGVQLCLTGWPGVPLTHSLTQHAKATRIPPHRPPATHLAGTGDSKDSHPRCCQQPLERYLLNAPAVRLTPPCPWGGRRSSPLPTAQSQAHSPGLPWSQPPRTAQHRVLSLPAAAALALSLPALLNRMFHPGVQPCPAPRALKPLTSPQPVAPEHQGHVSPRSGLPCST